MDDSHYLQGGREDHIIKQGNTVHRPTGPWTKQVHALLRHLRKKGFYAAPEPLGFDAEGREIVSFIKGEVSNYPLSHHAASTNALISAAKLLREFHDASQSFLTEISPEKKHWQLPPREPQEIICHGDYAPYNVVLHGEKAIGIIDFDTCHPGPRIWDIAYALYRWAPFTNPHNQDGFGSIEEQIKRGRLFCQSYGLVNEEKPALASLMIERLQALVDFMMSEAQLGNKTIALNMQNNHHLLYLADIEYIRKHLTNIELGFID
ncbi:Phosphotransferase enzyme family protein [Legionella santicrucis]|uniref:Phosphotransferase enzyme family protein n=1 Tax=Legionella santicrucis TaxID=45074 RepID=A0A0W0YIR3_9GAMM|nr:aminoglycoside phosphotransferase family protein [Legionella santicrucis]KTD56754.1 Phosphotransferase enzyme family protein [Legionella santicrucis]